MKHNPLDPAQPLPNNEGAEIGVIACCFDARPEQRQLALTIAGNALLPDSFYNPAHQTIWRIMMEERAKGNPITEVSIGSLLYPHGLNADFAEMVKSERTHADGLTYFLDQVVNCALLRKTFQVLYTALQNVADPRVDAHTSIAKAQNELNLCAASTAMEAGRTLKSLLMDVVDNMRTHDPKNTAIPTGIKPIDSVTNGGVRRGQLCLIGALRHLGKTSLARCIALNQGKSGYKVLCFFAESSDADEGANSMAVLTGYAAKNFTGQKESNLFTGLSKKMIEAATTAPDIRIDTTASLSIEVIENRARYLKQTKGLDVIFVDYLQFLQGDQQRGQNREQQVSEQARRLKILARELDVSLYLLVQLNDEISPEEAPEIRHIRESKGPSNHADCILLMSSPNGIGHDPSNSETQRQLRQLWNRKWRGVGAMTKPINLDFHGPTQKFSNETATISFEPEPEPKPKSSYARRF